MITIHPPASIASGSATRDDIHTISATASELESWSAAPTHGGMIHATLIGEARGHPEGLARALIKAGVVTLTVSTPVELGTVGGREDLGLLGVVRGAVGAGLPVSWSVTQHGAMPQSLVHLTPPTLATTGELHPEWVEAHHFPLLTVRYGPGFAVVKDVRSAELAARYVLDDELMVELAKRLTSPVAVDSLTIQEAEHLGDLLDAQLVLVRSGYATFLPLHLRLWPVPSTAI